MQPQSAYYQQDYYTKRSSIYSLTVTTFTFLVKTISPLILISLVKTNTAVEFALHVCHLCHVICMLPGVFLGAVPVIITLQHQTVGHKITATALDGP